MFLENEAMAYKWRASTFSAYDRCELLTSSISLHTLYKMTADDIENILSTISQEHFPGQDNAKRLRGLMAFIVQAGQLAIALNRQAAKLEIMDKSWFERNGTTFIPNDDRMSGRLGEEDEDEEAGFQVHIILNPGFLKYGDGSGRYFGTCAVWIPATLDLSDPHEEEGSPPSIHGDVKISPPENPHTMHQHSTKRQPFSFYNRSKGLKGSQTIAILREPDDKTNPKLQTARKRKAGPILLLGKPPPVSKKPKISAAEVYTDKPDVVDPWTTVTQFGTEKERPFGPLVYTDKPDVVDLWTTVTQFGTEKERPFSFGPLVSRFRGLWLLSCQDHVR